MCPVVGFSAGPPLKIVQPCVTVDLLLQYPLESPSTAGHLTLVSVDWTALEGVLHRLSHPDCHKVLCQSQLLGSSH
jgi:hypothetical protein